MVYRPATLDAVFRALADRTRREILERIAGGTPTISELAARFDMSLPAVSKHVRVLERAGLARIRQQGRVRRATLRPRPMRQAQEFIERYRKFWESELDLLARYLEEPQPPESPWPSKQPPSLPSRSAGPSGRPGRRSSRRGPRRSS